MARVTMAAFIRLGSVRPLGFPNFVASPVSTFPGYALTESGIFPALDAVNELEDSIGRLVDAAAGEDAAGPPAVQVEDVREPGIHLQRVGADMRHLHASIHRVDGGEDHIELSALDVEVDEIDRLGQELIEPDRRHLFEDRKSV